jgi:hypothetical protein
VGKIDISISDISNDLLASANIYWRQKSGVEILISAKGDILNMGMLEKISASGKSLVIDDSDEFSINKHFLKIFRNYESAISIKEKKIIRKEFNLFLMKLFYHSNKSQFELDQLCWKLFSTLSISEGFKFLDRDQNYFKRSMSVASSCTVLAFLIGYYDEKFLRELYSRTLKNLMGVGNEELIFNLKTKLESIREKGSLTVEDKNFIREIIDIDDFDQSLLFEKSDGSGLMEINIYEMTDLELILSSLNYFYNYSDMDNLNILAMIRDDVFPIEKRLLNLIRDNFEKLAKDLVAAA